MRKNRQALTCNGRPAFYAAMYEDIRYVASHCGWAVALHGSLASDMDIIAIPWVDSATSFEYLIEKIVGLFDENMISENYLITYNEKPHGRTVATIPIWEDFYLDISTVDIRKPMQEIVEKLEEDSKHYALKVLEMFLHKQCDLERTKFAYKQEEVWASVKMATEALEKQIPKKPILSEPAYMGYYKCPNCREIFDSDEEFYLKNEIWNCCSKCGQVIDWNKKD